ncbi:MAG: restriction endonuclease subunit S [Flavipsychrobacter sp.]
MSEETKILPKGWDIKHLNDLCDTISVNKIKLKQKEYLSHGKFPVVDQGQEIIGGYSDKEEYIVPSNPPYIVYGDHTKVKKYITFDFIAGADGVKVLKPKGSVNPKYFFYLLHVVKIPDKGYARHFQFLKKADFPTPSPKIQEAIVAKIETLFSELDNGIAQLKTAQQQLDTYRQSVLKWAFEGKLTNKNVKDGELPQGWEWVRLVDVCNKIQDGSHYSPKNQFDQPGKNRYLYITAKNIRNDRMEMSKVIYTDKEFFDTIYNRCNPEYGDVLLTKDGINTGHVTLNTLKEPFALLSSVCLFKTDSSKLSPAFLKYYIQSPIGKRNIIGQMSGTAIKRIILKKIKTSEIYLPPQDVQSHIVQEIESRLSVADKLQETITTSLAQAESLRQSILKQAFEGKLV